MATNGKGSGRRPNQVGKDVFESNWDAIFGKKSKPAEPVTSAIDTGADKEHTTTAEQGNGHVCHTC